MNSGVDHEQVALKSGRRLRLPFLYHDWTIVMAHFPASASRVQKLLPGAHLKPALAFPGVTLVTFAGIRYLRNGELAPYDEVIIGVPVMYAPRVNVPVLPLLLRERLNGFGFYPLYVPVTTEEARDSGIELWGFPKFVAEIDFEERGKTHRCHLREGGQEILTLEVANVRNPPGSYRFASLTVKDGQLLKTPIRADGQIGTATLRGGASFKLGDHPIAQQLRSLNIRPWTFERLVGCGLRSALPGASEHLAL